MLETIVGSCWSHVGFNLGSFLDYLWVILVSFWVHFGVIGVILGTSWDHLGTKQGFIEARARPWEHFSKSACPKPPPRGSNRVLLCPNGYQNRQKTITSWVLKLCSKSYHKRQTIETLGPSKIEISL